MGRGILAVDGDWVGRRGLVLEEAMTLAKCWNLCAAGIDFPIKLKLKIIKKYKLSVESSEQNFFFFFVFILYFYCKNRMYGFRVQGG